MSLITKVKLQGLWNSEYPQVIINILDIIKENNPEELHLGLSYARLDSFRGDLAKIEVMERASAESRQLSELDQIRDTYYNVILSIAKSHQRVKLSKYSDAGNAIASVFKKRKSDIPVANYTAETKRLNDLIAEIESKKDVLAALETLKLIDYFYEMKQTNIDFNKLFVERAKKQADEKVDTGFIRSECDKALTIFWKDVEVCCQNYGKEKYMTMISYINQLNAYYKQQLEARAARRRAKQNVAEEKEIEHIVKIEKMSDGEYKITTASATPQAAATPQNNNEKPEQVIDMQIKK
jgi:hypothetical protein